MIYCIAYGQTIDPSRWFSFCKEHNIPRFTEKAIDAAFDDKKLREETLLFAHDIGEEIKTQAS